MMARPLERAAITGAARSCVAASLARGEAGQGRGEGVPLIAAVGAQGCRGAASVPCRVLGWPWRTGKLNADEAGVQIS
jgi:hypothetical protein